MLSGGCGSLHARAACVSLLGRVPWPCAWLFVAARAAGGGPQGHAAPPPVERGNACGMKAWQCVTRARHRAEFHATASVQPVLAACDECFVARAAPWWNAEIHAGAI
eukprot:11184331-Lingulodinium_polyedra.AAC.1